ncbi:cytochrome c [Marimonas arenosa]|uniref:Cytochrome c n=1 Tax=Marimonas arenosa TaxID=1795305 RepID=A0AAE3WEA6_9RHOB|nr:cytochrome c [Marimonas arenosa]
MAIAMPPEMTDSGFAQHLLPRFKFRHRIALDPVAPDSAAELAFRREDGVGEAILIGRDGTVYRLVFAPDSATGRKFADWLRSGPGQKTLESFPKDGPPLFTLFEAPAEQKVEAAPTGDVALGSELALLHCGRCHVVDKRNRMGGIGSTPSFGALRARANWHDLFLKFWVEPPHPSFTLIPGMTEEFTDSRPARIHPVKLSDIEVNAIIAFIATMKPKDLGAPIRYD